MKRIVTIQDISCIGKCSLTVALPVLSAMGIETAILPTAVLSTHTMFSNPACADLTDWISPIQEHWKKEGFSFDAIYTGYLGSIRQIDLVSQLIDTFRTTPGNPLVLVDPAMADNGTLYTGFTADFVREMSSLCGKADLIVPNITEATLMTGLPYRETYDAVWLNELLDALAALGPASVILTGVTLTPGCVGVMTRDSRTGHTFSFETEKQPRSYHGTGDLFASTLLGAIMRSDSLEESLKLACRYVSHTIAATIANPDSRSYGVDFETTLPWLIGQL